MKKLFNKLFSNKTTDTVNSAPNYDKNQWLTTANILDLKQLDDGLKSKILKQIDEEYSALIQKHRIENDFFDTWHVYEGDLTLEKSFACDKPLIVTGNLTIQGIYDDSIADEYDAKLIVQGEMYAEHIICRHYLSVTGDVHVSGLIYHFYSEEDEQMTEFLSNIHCRGMFVDKKNQTSGYECLFSDFFIEAEFNDVKAADYIDESILVENTLLTQYDGYFYDDEDEEAYQTIDINKLREALLAGSDILKPISRPTHIPKEAKWDVRRNLWEYGEKDECGNYIGECTYWTAPSGYVSSVFKYADDGFCENLQEFDEQGVLINEEHFEREVVEPREYDKTVWLCVDDIEQTIDLNEARKQDISKQIEDKCKDELYSTKSQVLESLANEQYLVFDGDLTIDKSLHMNKNLLVTGDVSIAGDMDNDHTNHTLIVLGNIAVNNISSYPLVVLGNIQSKGLTYDSVSDYVRTMPIGQWMVEEDFKDKFIPLDSNKKQEIIQYLTSKKVRPYDFEIAFYRLEDDSFEWDIHEGDLVLDKSYYAEYDLIVTGDLIINGIYDDQKITDGGSVIVMGNMQADHIVSTRNMTILGDVNVKGIIYNYYNDHTFECQGDVSCKVFFADDKDVRCYGKVNCEYDYMSEATFGGNNPKYPDAVLIEAVFEIDNGGYEEALQDAIDEGIDKPLRSDYMYVNSDKVSKLLAEGQDIFLHAK